MKCSYSDCLAPCVAEKKVIEDITSRYGNKVVFCSFVNTPGPAKGAIRVVTFPTASQIISFENQDTFIECISGNDVIVQDIRCFYKEICDASFSTCAFLCGSPFWAYVVEDDVFSSLLDVMNICEKSSSWRNALKTSLEAFVKSGNEETKTFADLFYEEYFTLKIPFATAFYNVNVSMFRKDNPGKFSSDLCPPVTPAKIATENELEAAANILKCKRDFERGLRMDFTRILLSKDADPYNSMSFA